MKFQDYAYQRPELNTYRSFVEQWLVDFKEAKDAQAQIKLMDAFNMQRNHVQTMSALSSVRHSIDTKDAFYDTENTYWDEHQPLYEELNAQFYQTVLSSAYLDDLKAYFPQPFFLLAENALKAFDPSIIDLLQEENKRTSDYEKLLASAEIEFQGKTYNLSQMTPFTLSKDRSVRHESTDKKMAFFQEHEATLDLIYDDLVKLRDKIAKRLGFNNFVELGYVRMNRLDYDAKMVDVFRKQVRDGIVPLAQSLYQRQAKRLQLDDLAYYDVNYEFESGNPTPKGSYAEIVSTAQTMYDELSAETGQFFSFMQTRELLDLVAKPGKRGGGYCTYLPNYQSPFIFSNFNGTQGDVEVLTHEAGHAFQVYQSRWVNVPECVWPTLESCEIHSMSMEFLTWPWMDRFFKEDTDKFKFSHLGGAIKFIPYGVCVDHFQHEIYAHPDMSPSDRKALWRQLEKTYLPHKKYTGNDFLERGGFWFQQLHIFVAPFYYIDYTLAQICALQFWKRTQDDDPNTLKDYLHLCSLGGTKSFVQLVKEANLISPFEEGCVESVVHTVKNYLEQIDDTSL
jgi:M3 family oligoendopeptidase